MTTRSHLEMALAVPPDRPPNANHGTVCRASVRNGCPFQGQGCWWVGAEFLLTSPPPQAERARSAKTLNTPTHQQPKVKIKNKNQSQDHARVREQQRCGLNNSVVKEQQKSAG